MKLSIGIVGLPNVGKSSLFKILTKQEVYVANYPFATIDPNVGVVPVPDERLAKLAKMSASKKTIPAIVEFYDIAGLVKGAYKGEGLGNQFLSHIRDVSAIVEVVRIFPSPEIVHVEEKVDPIRDIEIIGAELALKDLETIDKKIGKLEGEARSGDKKKIEDLALMKKLKEIVDSGRPASDFLRGFSSSQSQQELLGEINLLTAKEKIYLLNGGVDDVNEDLKAKIKSLGADYVICDLSRADNLNELIAETYKILGLISFLTTGEDETRAWTIKDGAKAPEAAGVIHSDFEKKFIRAETIDWQKLLEAGSWNEAKRKGWLRTEGKDYIVQDGDVMVIRHS